MKATDKLIPAGKFLLQQCIPSNTTVVLLNGKLYAYTHGMHERYRDSGSHALLGTSPQTLGPNKAAWRARQLDNCLKSMNVWCKLLIKFKAELVLLYAPHPLFKQNEAVVLLYDKRPLDVTSGGIPLTKLLVCDYPSAYINFATPESAAQAFIADSLT